MRARAAEIDEQSLIEAAQRQPSRFGELYERNFDRVYAYVARRAMNRAEAEDVVSEVFHKALKNLKQFEWRGTPFAGWLMRIAANALADRRRDERRERGSVMVREPVAISRAEKEEAEEEARLAELVGTLPVDQRRVVEMRFVEEKSIEEIAAALGRSTGAVKQLQFRALRKLRERMGKRDG